MSLGYDSKLNLMRLQFWGVCRHTFITITSGFTLIVYVRVPFTGEIDLFENYYHETGILETI